MKTIEKIQEARLSLNELIENSRQAIREELLELFKEVLEKSNYVKRIYWRQYTPYFNDGEPCEFDIYDIWFQTNTEDDMDEEYSFSVWGEEYSDYHNHPEEEHQMYYELNQTVQSLGDVLESVFGDHVEISYTKGDEDFLIDHYYHD